MLPYGLLTFSFLIKLLLEIYPIFIWIGFDDAYHCGCLQTHHHILISLNGEHFMRWEYLWGENGFIFFHGLPKMLTRAYTV